MKKSSILLSLAGSLLFIYAIDPAPRIAGHWISKGPNDSTVYLDFSNDGKFKVSVGTHVENQGRFTFENNVFSMADSNCGTNVVGTYKLTFYTADSVGFSLIADSCKDRAGEINGGRIKRAMQ